MNRLQKNELSKLSKETNNVKVEELNGVFGSYMVTVDNIQAHLLFPDGSPVTMALSFGDEMGIVVTYNFELEEDLKFILDLIHINESNVNYCYIDSTKRYQLQLQNNVRIYLNKENVIKLLAILYKIQNKLVSLNVIG